MIKKSNAAVQAYNHNECLSCFKTIINPLCPNCITKHFKEWVKAYPHLKKESEKIENFVRKSKNQIGERCIICKKKVFMCVYCFTEYIYNLLKKAGAGPKILNEFLFIFNYDFKKIGYSKDLETFGGY